MSFSNGSEFCEANFKDTIEFFNSPNPEFIIPVICEEDSFQIIDNTSSIDSVVSYLYVFDALDSSINQNPTFKGIVSGEYSLKLSVVTLNGCESSIQKMVLINEKPDVRFSILNNNSGVPFSMDLTNTTTGGSSYLWTFGNGDSSADVEPQYVYRDTGTFDLQLFASSDLGCIDSLKEQVVVRQKFIDAALTRLFLTENDLGDINTSFQIVNTGFNTINELVTTVDINNEFEFREKFITKLYSGETQGFQMNSSFIPDAGRKVDFVCVRILSVNNVNDSIASNNELCEKGFSDELRVDLFPNPIETNLNLQYTLPDDGEVELLFFDALGRQMDIKIGLMQEEGYYSLLLDLSSFERGVYFYRFTFNGIEKTGKLLKR